MLTTRGQIKQSARIEGPAIVVVTFLAHFVKFIPHVRLDFKEISIPRTYEVWSLVSEKYS